MTVLCPSSKAAQKSHGTDQSKAFKIRGYHQHCFDAGKKMDSFKKRLDLLADLGYNLVVFGMGHPRRSVVTVHEGGRVETIGCSKEDLKELVAYAIKKGLEPVFEIKFIGKQLPIIKHLLKKYPELVINKNHRGTVLNINYKPDGKRNACEMVILPLIDFLLSLYPQKHPAKYFLLGIDEFNASDMALLAKSLKVSPAKAFAMSLDQGTNHLLAKGITPLIWGDVLLSDQLGTKDNGITLPGFKNDPRLKLKSGGAYNSNFRSKKDQKLFQMVNYLKNKDKIIVVDWHYDAAEEYPSVDYFQSIGFKDVWGATWYSQKNIENFSKYAYKRHCGGMVATAWHFAVYKVLKLFYLRLLYQSSTYFHIPDFNPPQEPYSYTLSDDKGKILGNEAMTGIIPPSTKSITLKTNKPEGYDKHILFIANLGKPQLCLQLPIKDCKNGKLELKFELPANIRELKTPAQFILQIGHINSKNNYFILNNSLQGFVYGKENHRPLIADKSDLLFADFAKVTAAKSDNLWFEGICSTPINIVNNSKAPTIVEGALNVGQLDAVWATPSDAFNRQIQKSMNLQMEVKMTGNFEKGGYCGLLTMGYYGNGCRLLIDKRRRVLFQIAKAFPGGKPLWLYSTPLPINEWASIKISYKAPQNGKPGKASIAVNDQSPKVTDVPSPIKPGTLSVIGIGCQFSGDPILGSFTKQFPIFPGLIRKISIK